MVPVMSLWLPILVSSVIVFVASSIIHMVLPYHRSDMRQVPKEDDVLAAFRGFKIPPGDYGMPHPGSMAGMRAPAFIEKMKAGPLVTMTVSPGSEPGMAKNLTQWFIYLVVVGVCAAYLAGRALGPGAPYLQVFRFAGTAAFLAYSLALAQNSIWYRRNWGTTLKSMFDGLIYGMLTAGTFGWLWPR
jgi:Flp pilus assembly protein TadB